jgi:hypothetical protein
MDQYRLTYYCMLGRQRKVQIKVDSFDSLNPNGRDVLCHRQTDVQRHNFWLSRSNRRQLDHTSGSDRTPAK